MQHKYLLNIICYFDILYPAQKDLDDEVDDLNSTHDGETGEEAKGAADYRDLRHSVCLGILSTLILRLLNSIIITYIPCNEPKIINVNLNTILNI